MSAVPSSDLAVRGSARYQCGIDALLVVGQEHAKLVRPDKSATGAGGPVSIQVVDISLGGAGLRCALFFPRLCRLSLTLTPPGGSQPITLDLRAHRVTMLDRAPTYYIGAGFEELSAEQTQAVQGILDHLKASGAQLVTEHRRA